MSEGAAFIFTDPDRYAAAFGDVGLNLTITGAGDFRARLTRLKLQHIEVYGCDERLPRIAYLSLPPERVFLSLPFGETPPVFDGFVLRNGNMVQHGRAEHMHQRSEGECQWTLISMTREQLTSYSKAVIGNPIVWPDASRIVRPRRVEAHRFQNLIRHACRVGAGRNELIERIQVARALEEKILHAIVHCLTANDAVDNSKTRHHHAAIMVCFEAVLSKHFDQTLTMPELCQKIGVPERTLRMCCAKFLGVSPMRYILLRRLNKVRLALRRADPSRASVAEIARNHQFLEFGRFAVTYRSTFGESPSVTLHQSDSRV
jgi:AraC-like DNA-binding protein